jgi:ferredoxin-like protein FixX
MIKKKNHKKFNSEEIIKEVIKENSTTLRKKELFANRQGQCYFGYDFNSVLEHEECLECTVCSKCTDMFWSQYKVENPIGLQDLFKLIRK